MDAGGCSRNGEPESAAARLVQTIKSCGCFIFFKNVIFSTKPDPAQATCTIKPLFLIQMIRNDLPYSRRKKLLLKKGFFLIYFNLLKIHDETNSNSNKQSLTFQQIPSYNEHLFIVRSMAKKVALTTF